MAPNGTGRKAPAGGKPKTFNFVSQSTVSDTLGTDAKKQSVRLRDDVTKRLPKASQPGNWDSDVVGGGLDKDMSSVVSRVPLDVARAFVTGHPMQDKPDIVRCNHCKRPVLRHKAKAHIEECIQKKQEKQRKKKEAKDARDAAARKAERDNADSESEDEEEGIEANKTAGKTSGSAAKKRKAEDHTEAGKKKKKKDEPKAKAARPKAPVDVEKQCGVPLANGAQCARSLTCKSHSMGAKRAVRRSAPYDKLLAEYQRKNQAKLQKQALEAQQPYQDDEFAQAGPIDSDEEKDLVLAAIARSQPRPLFQSQPVPLKRKYQWVRMKEMMSGALGGKGAGLFRTAPPPEDVPMQDDLGMHQLNGMNPFTNPAAMNAPSDNDRRSSGMGRTMTVPHSRKPSAVIA